MTDLLQLARECGAVWEDDNGSAPIFLSISAESLATFAQRIREDEREICAAICDNYFPDEIYDPERGTQERTARDLATAIRSGTPMDGKGDAAP